MMGTRVKVVMGMGRPFARMMGQTVVLYGDHLCLYLRVNGRHVMAVKARLLEPRGTCAWPRQRLRTRRSTFLCSMTWQSTCGPTVAGF